jgi:hypothetical protein
MMAAPAVVHASSGACFCCKECHVSWAERLGIDDAEAQAPLTAAAALAAAADWQRTGGRRSAVITERPAAPDSYVENRHEQIRRRGSSLGQMQSGGSPQSRTSSVSRSQSATPRLKPIEEPAGGDCGGGGGDGAVTGVALISPRSVITSTSVASRSLQSMCVEEFDEELDAAVPSPPVRIPPARPIHSLKPFALPPPARY